MSHPNNSAFRAPDEEVTGAAGCLWYLFFLAAEVAVGAVAGMIAFHFGSGEMVDMLDALGIGMAIVFGGFAIWTLDSLCRRWTGHRPLLLLAEAVAWL